MEPSPGEEQKPAPLFLRMVAFVMDCIFVVFASLILVQGFFPDEIASGRKTMESYNDEMLTLEEAANRGDRTANEAMQRLLENLIQEPSWVAMIEAVILSFLCTAITYWFVGERFFAGSSLGKRMFSLATINLTDGNAPGTGIALFRSFLKAIPLVQQYLTLSYLVALFNRRRRTGHDWACRTVVIRGQVKVKEQEESTNSLH